MIIYLPSNGKAGIVKLDQRQPKIADLRDSQNYSDISAVRKTQFVQALLSEPEMLNECTPEDRDMLFAIAIASINMNKFTYVCTCSACNAKQRGAMELATLEPVFLTTPLELTRKIGDREFTFHKLRVKDELECIDWAMLDDDLYEQRLEEAQVCKALGYDLTEENIELVLNLDIAVYYSAILFQMCCPHGINLSEDYTCSCGKESTAILAIEGSLLEVDLASHLDRFTSLAGNLDYSSFMNMSVPELDALVTALNAKNAQ